MNISSIRNACIILILAGVVANAQSQAQGDPQWLQVKSLPAGEQVEVRLQTNKKVQGTIASVSDSEVVLIAKEGQLNILKTEIRQLGVKRDSARLRKGIGGAVIGAIAGAVIVAAAGGAFSDGSGVNGGAVVRASAGGAVIGFGLGLIPSAYRTIYSSRPAST